MQAMELTQRLNNAVSKLLNLAIASDSPSDRQRLTEKRAAVEEGLALWFRASHAAPRKDTIDMVIDVETALKNLRDVSSGGKREGYGLVLSYLSELDL